MERALLRDKLPEISDDYMRESLAKTRRYTIAIMKKGPAYDPPRSDAVIWEHGRRNFALRGAKLLAIVCPIPDQSELAGIGLFATDADTLQDIMMDDPAVKAGVLTFEVHPTFSFPGD